MRAVGYDSDEVQVLVAEVQQEYVRRYGDEGDTAPVEAAQFAPPDGLFLLVYVDGEPAASGGWRRGGPEGDTDAEIKRMYVRPAHQRRGHARRLLAALERSAAEAGAQRMVLETGLEQPEAIELYRSAGYEPVPPFGYYADAPLSVHLARRLTGPPSPPGEHAGTTGPG